MATRHAPQRRKGGWKLWIIPVLLILLVAGLARSQKDALLDKLGLQQVDDSESQSFVVGEEVTVSGSLSSSNNLRHYTMMLTTAEDGIFGVKSNVLDLSSYRGKSVIVRGAITTIVNNVPVINAVSLVANDDTVTDDGSAVTDVQYIADAGMILDPDALEGYTVSSDSDTVTFTHEDGTRIALSYFACSDDQSSVTGCAYILDQLSDSPSRFTGTDGDERVQLSETNARFGSNNDRIGYRISDADKSTVTSLMDGITFVNDRYITKQLIPLAKDACQTVDHTLNYVADSSSEYVGDTIRITLEGTDTENMDVTCVVDIDPRTNKATLTSIDGEDDVDVADNENNNTNEESNGEDQSPEDDNTSDNTTDQGDTEGETSVNTDAAPALGTELPFTSSKGYTIVFPSSNVAFQGVNNTESLGIDGVAGCRSQMNVVAFSNAANVVDSPAIVMYDCRDVDDTIGPLNGYIRKDGTESDKTFFIKVINPEWNTFANAITIK